MGKSTLAIVIYGVSETKRKFDADSFVVVVDLVESIEFSPDTFSFLPVKN